jgi:succinate-semialdehyde dehydrogenase/glutarate-semialdehyde dehydrogenase
MLKLDNNSLIRDQAYIDGEWRGAKTGARFAVRNPATGEVIAEVADLDEEDVRDAIAAADRALASWKGKTAKERASVLRKWYELMMASQEDLAQLMTAEQGKPLAESRGEIAYGASFIEWFAEEGKRIYGDVIPTNAHGRRILVTKEAIGVVGAVTPWNFPNAMITRKVGPALAAGCPVVVKPAQLTPLSALALAELAHRAGLPKGVFNVVTSTESSRVGKELTTNPLVKKFSFTGSTEVGKQLMAQCASTVKKVSLELGGNAPFIVFDDADLDAAVKGAVLSKFRNMGQTCVCANRFLVQDGIYDAFAAKLKTAVATLKVGDGAQAGIEQGPLINMAAVEKVEALIADGVKHGAKIDIGGKRHRLGGTFFEPTILRDATPEMAFAREEIFGPVATLFRFAKDEDAIRMANDTEYGLAAYFYARDVGRIFKVMEGLQYGIVGVNEGIISTEVAPFGGMKESGIGREGSKYGIDDFVQIKYVAMGGLGIP